MVRRLADVGQRKFSLFVCEKSRKEAPKPVDGKLIPTFRGKVHEQHFVVKYLANTLAIEYLEILAIVAIILFLLLRLDELVFIAKIGPTCVYC